MTSTTIGKHKTQVVNDEGFTKVFYHDTCIVKFDEVFITLDSGGFRSDPDKGWSLYYSYDGKDWENIEDFETKAEAHKIMMQYRFNTQAGYHNIGKTTINGQVGSGVTTRRRFEQVAKRYLLKFSVYQEKYKWYVATDAGVFDFFDGIEICRTTGKILNCKQVVK